MAASAFLLLTAPSVTARDAGELTTAAFGLDVPHPTGFAADMVLLRLAMLLVPVGDVAFRANALTAVAMGAAAALAARLAYALLDAAPAPAPTAARAVLAALPIAALVASRTTLRAGTAVEVYATALCASLAVLAAACLPTDAPVASARRLVALALGASLALHTSTRLAALLALAAIALRGLTRHALPRRAGALAACALAGALPVVYLPLRAARGGPIDWGDPRTPARLWAHLSAARIRAAFGDRILVAWRIPEDLARAMGVLHEDLGAPLLVLAAAGTALALRRGGGAAARWIAAAALLDFAYAVLINPMGIEDRQTLFLTEAALVVLAALACGRAAAWVVARGADERARAGARGVVAVLAAVLIALTVARVDTAYAGRADGWSASEVLGGAGALGAVPPRALVLCESDDLCGVALFARYVEGERPDVVTLPRQHLADPSTWRRARPDALGAPVPAPSAAAAARDLRAARLRALVRAFGPRVRWEMGELEDERIARARLGSGETPVLAALDAPVTDVDLRADAWLAPRTPRGVGARQVAAHALFSAGRRAATLPDPSGAPPLAAAAALWARAIALWPEHAGAWTNLGVARARMGDLAGAVALTERAVALDPDRPTAWENLAEFRAARGDADGARAAREALSRRRPRAAQRGE